MDKFVINGGNSLSGTVRISGSKNAALPLMAAVILADGYFTIENVPALTDVRTMGRLLKILGAKFTIEDETLKINTTGLNNYEAPYELVKTMRASIYVLGPLLARFGKAKVSLPGGCAWGPRPVNLHLEGLKALGAEIKLEGGYIIASAPRLKGGKITLDFPSVGATGNLMMAAALAKGETVIENAAREPDIAFLAEFLTAMGAGIEGVGKSILKIEGKDNLRSCSFQNIPDRIEAGTFLVAGAISGGDITLTNCQPDHCNSVIEKLELAGCIVKSNGNSIRIWRENDLQPVSVSAEVYPGYPTDLQAQWIALMSLAKGVSSITDNIYIDRFTHVAELMRLGADIRMEKNTAIVKGSERLKGAQVMSTDIRASASLILAGLAAEGRTDVSRIYHIDRGYYKIEEKLRSLGADIERRAGTL